MSMAPWAKAKAWPRLAMDPHVCGLVWYILGFQANPVIYVCPPIDNSENL